MNSVMSRRGFVAGVVAATAAAGTGMPLAAEAQTQWDTSYDVIVIGYGIAGATAARHAADAGATVLLVDGAPDGAEGGNSKFAKQLLASGHDVESALAYLKALNAGFDVPEDMLRLFAERMVDLPAYCAEYLGRV